MDIGGEGVVLIRLAFSCLLGKSSPSICLRLLVEIFSSCLQCPRPSLAFLAFSMLRSSHI